MKSRSTPRPASLGQRLLDALLDGAPRPGIQSSPPASPASAASIDLACMRDLVSRIGDPVVAALVVEHFKERELSNRFPGVYLAALETLKRSHIQYAQAQAKSQAMHSAGITLAKVCIALVRTTVKGGVFAFRMAR